MKKILLFTLILICFSSIVYSLDPSFYYKKGEDINITVPCTINNTPCKSTTTCNITIINPVSMTIIDNARMEYTSTYYGFKLNSSNSYLLGDYNCIIYCYDNSTNYAGYSMFTLNLNNQGLKTGYFSNLISVVITFIITIIFFIILGFIDLFRSYKWLGVTCFSIAFLELVLLIGTVYADDLGIFYTSLLKINFLSIFIIGFIVLMLTFVFIYMDNLDIETEKKMENNKWIGHKWE